MNEIFVIDGNTNISKGVIEGYYVSFYELPIYMEGKEYITYQPKEKWRLIHNTNNKTKDKDKPLIEISVVNLKADWVINEKEIIGINKEKAMQLMNNIHPSIVALEYYKDKIVNRKKDVYVLSKFYTALTKKFEVIDNNHKIEVEEILPDDTYWLYHTYELKIYELPYPIDVIRVIEKYEKSNDERLNSVIDNIGIIDTITNKLKTYVKTVCSISNSQV